MINANANANAKLPSPPMGIDDICDALKTLLKAIPQPVQAPIVVPPPFVPQKIEVILPAKKPIYNPEDPCECPAFLCVPTRVRTDEGPVFVIPRANNIVPTTGLKKLIAPIIPVSFDLAVVKNIPTIAYDLVKFTLPVGSKLLNNGVPIQADTAYDVRFYTPGMVTNRNIPNIAPYIVLPGGTWYYDIDTETVAMLPFDTTVSLV